MSILIKEYLAEHTMRLQTGIGRYLVAIKIRLPKAMRALVIVASYNPPNGLDDRNHIPRIIAEKVKKIKGRTQWGHVSIDGKYEQTYWRCGCTQGDGWEYQPGYAS